MPSRKPPPPAMLSVEDVEIRSTWEAESEPTRVNSALAYFDTMCGDLAPRDVLLDALNLDDQGYMGRLLGLDVEDPRRRLRSIAVRAYGRLVEFRVRAERAAERDDLRAELEEFATRLAQRKDWRLSDAISGLKKSAGFLRPHVDFLRGDPRFNLLAEAGLVGENEREFNEAWALIDLSSAGLPILNESRAGDYGDPEFVDALRKALASVTVWPVDVDDMDFHVLQLAEIYALSFGRRVPTTYHPELGGGADEAFLKFIEANFGLADIPVSSPEGMLRHWRRFPHLRARLSRLTELGAAAKRGQALPFYLEEPRDFGSVGILEDLEAMDLTRKGR